MFMNKGVNIAVDNAIDELKKKANFITKPCEKDGIFHAIEKIINEKL